MGDVIPLRTGLAAVAVSSRLQAERLRALQAQLAPEARRAESRIRADDDANLREALAIYERLERRYCSPKTTPTTPKPRSKRKPKRTKA
jgi:hypothetical protein